MPDQSSDNTVDWGSSNKVERHMVVHHSSLLLSRWPELCIRVTDELMKVLALEVYLIETTHRIPALSKTRGAEPLDSAPLDAFVRIADSLVAAEVGHGLVQARAADAHEQQGDELSMNPARGGAARVDSS